jgi:hypothetical protein
VGDLTIFFSFGSIYPPLALVVFVAMAAHCIMFQLILGRFVTITRKYELLHHCWKTVQQDSEAVSSLLTMALPVVTALAAPFWSFILFDMLSDEVGTGPATWILFALASCLLLFRITGMYVSLRYIRSYWRRLFDNNSIDGGEAEMTKLDLSS